MVTLVIKELKCSGAKFLILFEKWRRYFWKMTNSLILLRRSVSVQCIWYQTANIRSANYSDQKNSQGFFQVQGHSSRNWKTKNVKCPYFEETFESNFPAPSNKLEIRQSIHLNNGNQPVFRVQKPKHQSLFNRENFWRGPCIPVYQATYIWRFAEMYAKLQSLRMLGGQKSGKCEKEKTMSQGVFKGSSLRYVAWCIPREQCCCWFAVKLRGSLPCICLENRPLIPAVLKVAAQLPRTQFVW